MKTAFLLIACLVTARAQTPVILISIDTLRADHLGTYGYRAIRTPNIDSLARGGTVFEQINSQIPLTLPSHTSLFTSTYPFENGVEENAEFVPKGAVTLASVLRVHGYATAAFVGSNLLDRRFGLDQGFENYDSPFGSQSVRPENPYSARVRRDGSLVLRAANQWLATHTGRPVFVFVHLFDLHAPYKLRPSETSALPETAGYDAELSYVDQLLGKFRQTLEQTGWWQRSLVVFLSDHGESLGEHGESSHGYFIYQSTVHVPLIMHWPADAPGLPARINEAAGLIDVTPTILDSLHIPAPPSYEGESLLKTARSRNVFSESVYTRDTFHWAALRSVRDENWKYIDAPRPELYDLAKDPGERQNVLRQDSAEVVILRTELNRLLARYGKAAHGASPDTSVGTRETLGSLGYIAGGAPKSSSGSRIDPKDRLPEYQLFERALDALYVTRFEAAISGFKRVLAEDPNNVPARSSLADAYARAGKMPKQQ